MGRIWFTTATLYSFIIHSMLTIANCIRITKSNYINVKFVFSHAKCTHKYCTIFFYEFFCLPCNVNLLPSTKSKISLLDSNVHSYFIHFYPHSNLSIWILKINSGHVKANKQGIVKWRVWGSRSQHGEHILMIFFFTIRHGEGPLFNDNIEKTQTITWYVYV